MAHWQKLIPVILGTAAIVQIVPQLDDVGVTIDEPQYFFAVERIQDWYALLATEPASALRDSTIRAAWDPPSVSYYNPHPPAYKQIMALTEALFGGLLGRVSGYRVAAAIEFALLVASVALVAGVVAGPLAATGAGLSLLAMPRVVGHAHIAATDMPLSLFWFLATYGLALHALRGKRAPLLIGGVALGLAMATKFTGWLLPVALLPWCMIERRAKGFLPWLLIGLLVAWASTPPAWTRPIGELSQLIGDSLARDSNAVVSTYYFGLNYGYVVPWHHPIVLTLITVPVGVLALSVAGGFQFIVEKRRSSLSSAAEDGFAGSLAGLAIIQVLFFMALVAMPQSPNHDGVRQWLPMFGFVAVLAGIGLEGLRRLVASRLRGRSSIALVAAVAVIFLAPGLLQSARVAPYFLSYYSGLIGGIPGARDRGMEVSYWAESVTPEFVAEMEARLPLGSRLVGHPVGRYYEELQDLGLLRADLHVIDHDDVDEWPPRYLVLIARKSFLPDRIATIYDGATPRVATELDGVILSAFFEYPDGLAPAPPPSVSEN